MSKCPRSINPGSTGSHSIAATRPGSATILGARRRPIRQRGLWARDLDVRNISLLSCAGGRGRRGSWRVRAPFPTPAAHERQHSQTNSHKPFSHALILPWLRNMHLIIPEKKGLKCLELVPNPNLFEQPQSPK